MSRLEETIRAWDKEFPAFQEKVDQSRRAVVPMKRRLIQDYTQNAGLPIGFNCPPVDTSRFDTGHKELWQESTFAVKIQDKRLTSEERAVLAKIGQRIYGGKQ